MTAAAKLEKAQGSLQVSRESLANLKAQLRDKQDERDAEILAREVGEGQPRKIQRLEKELEDLRLQVTEAEATVGIVEHNLPRLEADAALEAATEAVARFDKLIDGFPTTASVTNFIAEAEAAAEALRPARLSYLESVVSINRLRDNHGFEDVAPSMDLKAPVGLADKLRNAASRLTDIALGLELLGRATVTQLADRRKPQVCDCGQHRAEPNEHGGYDILASPASAEGRAMGFVHDWGRWGVRGADCPPEKMFPCMK